MSTRGRRLESLEKIHPADPICAVRYTTVYHQSVHSIYVQQIYIEQTLYVRILQYSILWISTSNLCIFWVTCRKKAVFVLTTSTTTFYVSGESRENCVGRGGGELPTPSSTPTSVRKNRPVPPVGNVLKPHKMCIFSFALIIFFFIQLGKFWINFPILKPQGNGEGCFAYQKAK